MHKIINKRNLTKALAALLCGTMVLGSTGYAAYRAGSENAAGTETNPIKRQEQTTDEAAVIGSNTQKNETVYVFADANGNVDHMLVCDWLRNTGFQDKLADVSNLTDIEVIKGNVTLDSNNQGNLSWNASGEDVYYQGNASGNLPVSIEVEYRLDGVSVNPSELSGKSGHVEIIYHFTNNTRQFVTIEGEQTETIVPFVMAAGTLLDSDVFRNVQVSNGKIINTGKDTAVVGFAIPGLQEALGIDTDKFALPEDIVISADVTNFHLGNVMIYGSSEILAGAELPSIDDLGTEESPEEMLTKLTSAMEQLTNGSSALYDGMTLLLEKSKELAAGVDQLADGAGQLQNGSGELQSGAEQLQAGIEQLQSGLQTLDKNSAALNAGGAQVFDALLAMGNKAIADAGIKAEKLTRQNYNKVLSGIIANMSDANLQKLAGQKALAEVTAQVNANRALIAAQVREAAYDQVLAAVLQTKGMTVEQYRQAVAAGLIDEATQKAVEQAVDTQLEKITEQKIQELITQTYNSKEVQDKIAAGVKEAKEGVKSLKELLESLKSYEIFYNGLNAYTAGVGSANQGAAALVAGSKKLTTGMKTFCAGLQSLVDGIGTLQNGVGQFGEGIEQLKDGSMQLSDGIKQLNDEGMAPILALVEQDGKGLLTRAQAMLTAAKEYRSFSGIADNTDGSVKFIYRLNAIE